jgi:large subunit ribosomal protein L15
MRGSRTHGFGQVGTHTHKRWRRMKGDIRVGRHKHLWTYTIKYEPDYFGKRGFTSPRSLRRKVNVINVRKLSELVEKLDAEKRLEKRKGKSFLDLEKLGYQKLLATGTIDKPVLVKVKSWSENAAKKIGEAGGQILTEQKEPAETKNELTQT